MPEVGQQTNPLLSLIDLGQRARAAASADELTFLVVNETKALIHYRQAVLWISDSGVKAVSGIVQVENNTPFVQYLNALCKTLTANDESGSSTPRVVSFADLSGELLTEWEHWLPREALWIPLPASAEHEGSFAGGVLLAADEVWNEAAFGIIGEWISTWHHAWLAKYRPLPWSFHKVKAQIQDWWAKQLVADQSKKWWQRKPTQILFGTLFVLCFPVRLTVLAPGELVPANPAVIRAPLDGVIGQFSVRPNQTVKAGDVLFSFDEAPIASRLEVARQALATAEAEYRQITQMALADNKSKGQLAVLLGKIGEKRAEAEFLESQFERAKVTAPQNGIAIFDDPTEWIGKPVQTGERVMRVANPSEVEIEAWIPIGDAVPLPEKADVSLYLSASPFFSVNGQVRYVGHDAMPRPEGAYAYRLRASLPESTDHRVGLKGTAKIYGGWVPFSYWVIRRPLAVIRQYLAI